MLILLPPSEGKSAPDDGPILKLSDLSFPELNPLRRRVVTELTRLCRTDPEAAIVGLGLGVQQSADVRADARIRRSPCAPAVDVYAGVLYDALSYSTLSAPARRRGSQRLAVTSALWGLLRPHDPIPYYRLSATGHLPGFGTLPHFWKPAIAGCLARSTGLVVDLRSGAYRALGPVPGSTAERTVTVRVLHESAGRRTIVSHHNKATKGRLVRALLEESTTPREPSELAGLLTELGFENEGVLPGKPGTPATIDVVVRSL